MGRYRGFTEDVAGPPIEIFQGALGSSWPHVAYTITFESFPVRLLLMLWLFVNYLMHSSFGYRQFNSNFTHGDPTILPYELITVEIVALLVTTCACPGRGNP
ncbi:hypothetical protein AVEN_126505-1 [Araneus ventricosus]|uniref:Uncharacterized protein n=1 Tax=Araneus ventricosus TaxID=182803 RepID=A0A4Y2CPN1_ARAVE|nr:hypothetical protein AVEN_126505-1 [Araneus ventricosus]